MSNLLINEPPLQVIPTLAKVIGLNEAIVLQQIHYWLTNKKVGKMENGRKWVRNTVDQWQEDNFCFWSTSTIRRVISSLEEKGLVISANLNRSAYDRTLWYTIDYEALAMLSIKETPFVQSDKMEVVNMDKPIPETTKETIKEKLYIEPAAFDLNADFVAELATISKETLAPGFNEKKFENAAFVLIGWDAELSDIAKFGEWWKSSGWHNQKPALTNIVNHWQDFKAGRDLRSKEQRQGTVKQANDSVGGMYV